jgi:hypothetical protein
MNGAAAQRLGITRRRPCLLRLLSRARGRRPREFVVQPRAFVIRQGGGPELGAQLVGSRRSPRATASSACAATASARSTAWPPHSVEAPRRAPSLLPDGRPSNPEASTPPRHRRAGRPPNLSSPSAIAAADGACYNRSFFLEYQTPWGRPVSGYGHVATTSRLRTSTTTTPPVPLAPASNVAYTWRPSLVITARSPKVPAPPIWAVPPHGPRADRESRSLAAADLRDRDAARISGS